MRVHGRIRVDADLDEEDDDEDLPIVESLSAPYIEHRNMERVIARRL